MPLQDDLRARRGDEPSAVPEQERGSSPPRRWDLLLACAVIVGPVVALGSWLATRQMVGDLEARLVRDVNELVARRYPRPVHVDAPIPGSLGDVVAIDLPPVEAQSRALRSDKEGLKLTYDVVSGAAPVKDLPAPFRDALARLKPHLDALLAASRRERADLPPTKDLTAPLNGAEGWLGYQLVATLTGVRMRNALSERRPLDALGDGLDGLALGRDAAITRGLVGRMVGVAIAARLTPPLAAAIDALPDAASRRVALRRIRTIRDAMPPFSRTLADEFVLTQLYMGDALSSRVRAALDPRVRGVLLDGLRDASWWQRLAYRDGWRDLRAAQDALIAAANLPEAQRVAGFAAATARTQRSPNPLAYIAFPNYLRYARRADGAQRRLDALVLAAATGVFREERRRWPSSVEEVAAVGDLTGIEASRLADVEFRADTEGRVLSLRVSLSSTDADEPRDVTLLLQGPGSAATRRAARLQTLGASRSSGD